jgi:hypothetical protein
MPGGGDVEGTTTVAASCDAVPLATEKTSAVTLMDAKPEKSGVTVAGGTCGMTLQQSAFPSHGMLMCVQQLCVADCAGITQVPTDSSNIPIMVIATAVRWLSRHNMAIRLPCT